MVISETSAKRALGKAFGDLRQGAKEWPELAPAEEKAVVFCKTADQMSFDERGYWGMSSAADERIMAREQRERSAQSFNQLDMY
jgi:hypothetical protein